jgi:cytochrome c peroxidase
MKTNASRAWSFSGIRATAIATGTVATAKVPAGTTPHALRIPNGFPAPELPADNPLTEEGIALGKRLFHDARLSSNDRQSCASCHQPARAFTEARPISLGAEQQPGTRHAPSLLHLAWHSRYAWDGRREKLRDAALGPISDAREMNLPIAQAVAKIAAEPEYRAQFARAFGDAPPDTGKDAVTAVRIGLALEQFLLTRTGASSKFDRVLAGQAKLTDEEARGFALFHTEFDPVRGRRGADCFHCHGGFDFSDHAFHDTGLGGTDPGQYVATGREADRGKFKTPTLRNVARTAPYFHDGRATTLEEAVAHYDHAVQRTPNLDPNLAKRGALNLSAEEQRALVAFLKTLTDE